jgi:hypothetical protein
MIDLSNFTLSETWPYAARLTMYLSGAAWIAVYGYMAAFAPKALATALDFTEFRQIVLASLPGKDVYALTVLNNSGKTVQVTELQLEWFIGQIPGGGLSSNGGIDAVYVLAQEESEFTVDSGDGALTVRIDKPFANDPYVKAVIPLAERLENEGSTRFLVAFGTDLDAVRGDTEDLRATLTFSNGTTVQRILTGD